jgi:hypothetical protein
MVRLAPDSPEYRSGVLSFMNDRHHRNKPIWSGWGDLDSHRRGATPGYHSMGTRTGSAKAKETLVETQLRP